MTTKTNVGERWSEARREFWNHPALKYANSMIAFQAVRTGTSGWDGESGDVGLDKFAETILEAQLDEVAVKITDLFKEAGKREDRVELSDVLKLLQNKR